MKEGTIELLRLIDTQTGWLICGILMIIGGVGGVWHGIRTRLLDGLDRIVIGGVFVVLGILWVITSITWVAR